LATLIIISSLRAKKTVGIPKVSILINIIASIIVRMKTLLDQSTITPLGICPNSPFIHR